MSFDWPDRREFTTSRGVEYSFVHIPSQQPLKPTFVLLHGFPSQSFDWNYQIEHLASTGNGVVALDLIGYGRSMKPDDVSKYRLRPQSDDIIELLDLLELSTVMGIGHDFGATLLSRAVAYYPDRWQAAIFIAIGPPQMGSPFDVNAINSFTKEMLGYEWLGYIPWLGGRTNAQECLEKHPESAMSLVFCADEEEQWTQHFRPLGKMEQFVRDDRRISIGSWYTPKHQSRHLEAFGQPDGYKGAVRWYQMWMENHFLADEKGYEKVEMRQPCLFIGGDGSEQQQELLKSWAPHLMTVNLTGAGHWVHLERSQETNQAIDDFAASVATK